MCKTVCATLFGKSNLEQGRYTSWINAEYANKENPSQALHKQSGEPVWSEKEAVGNAVRNRIVRIAMTIQSIHVEKRGLRKP